MIRSRLYDNITLVQSCTDSGDVQAISESRTRTKVNKANNSTTSQACAGSITALVLAAAGLRERYVGGGDWWLRNSPACVEKPMLS